MADTKISALAAVTSVVGAQEFAVNDAGVSKKASGTQVQDFIGKVVFAKLAADNTIASTTNELLAVDLALTVGTWIFDYRVIWQSNTATTGMSFGVNFTGTQTAFVVEGTQFEATTAASTGATDQVHATFGLRSGGAARAPSTTAKIVGSTSVDTINANMLTIVRGVVVVTVAGNLELYQASELVGGIQVTKAGTSGIAWRTAT